MDSCTIKNPALLVNGQRIEFPVELPSGSWIEYDGSDECVAYGSKGELLGRYRPSGTPPRMAAAQNHLEFSCGANSGPSPRARVTVFCQGEEL